MNTHGIQRSAPTIFRVPSDSDAEKFYLVDITSRIHSCTCTAYAISRNRAGGTGCQGKCKHLRYVEDFIDEERLDVKLQKKQQDADDAEEFERIRVINSLKATVKDLA